MNTISTGSTNEHPYPVPLHVQELIRYRDERKMLLFMLVGGEALEGAVRWFDDKTIHIVQQNRDELTLMRAAIQYYRPL